MVFLLITISCQEQHNAGFSCLPRSSNQTSSTKQSRQLHPQPEPWEEGGHRRGLTFVFLVEGIHAGNVNGECLKRGRQAVSARGAMYACASVSLPAHSKPPGGLAESERCQLNREASPKLRRSYRSVSVPGSTALLTTASPCSAPLPTPSAQRLAIGGALGAMIPCSAANHTVLSQLVTNQPPQGGLPGDMSQF